MAPCRCQARFRAVKPERVPRALRLRSAGAAVRVTTKTFPAASAKTVGSYTHNAFEQRVQKVAGGVTTQFVFDRLGHLLEEANSSGTVQMPSVEVKPGDILTLPRGNAVLVVRVLSCGIRRGLAREAQGLYETLDNSALDRAAAGS